jgi:hypothetical protein
MSGRDAGAPSRPARGTAKSRSRHVPGSAIFVPTAGDFVPGAPRFVPPPAGFVPSQHPVEHRIGGCNGLSQRPKATIPRCMSTTCGRPLAAVARLAADRRPSATRSGKFAVTGPGAICPPIATPSCEADRACGPPRPPAGTGAAIGCMAAGGIGRRRRQAGSTWVPPQALPRQYYFRIIRSSLHVRLSSWCGNIATPGERHLGRRRILRRSHLLHRLQDAEPALPA